MGLQLSEENMNQNALRSNNATTRAAKKSISQGTKKELQPLLDPTARATAGSCQLSQGKHLTGAQQRTAKPELNLQEKNSYRQETVV